MVAIKLTNKNNTPYGVLSVGYNDNIFIDGIIYNNIIDYVTKEYNLKLAQPYKLSLDNAWVGMEKNLINKALKKAIDSKIKTLPFFEDELLKTDNKNIIYISDSNVFGLNNKTKKGENLYGIWLTYFRNILGENSSKMFYNRYIFERLLSTAIYQEPLDSYLEMSRNGFGLSYIIKILMDKYGKSIDLPSEDIIENVRKLRKSNQYYIENNTAEEIIINVIKNKLREVKTVNLKKLRSKIFENFIKNIFKKNNISYDINTFIKKIDKNEYFYSMDRVFEAYLKSVEAEEIPENKDFYIPSEDDILDLENLTIKKNINLNKNIDKNYYVDEKISKLSMINDEILFDVDGKFFPSIYHYVIYRVGHLILGMDPYNMIFNPETNTFYRLNESKLFLKENIIKFKDFHFKQKLLYGLNSKINQKPYIIDFLKSIGDHKFITSEFYPQEVELFYNEVKQKINWIDIFSIRGNVIDFVDNDSFFLFTQREMFNSFVNIINIVTPMDYSHKNIIFIYENFFGNIPGVITNNYINNDLDITNLQQLSEDLGINFSKQTCYFLKNKFIDRILNAEKCAKILFKNTNIIYMTKFLIIESRYKIFNGAFIDENRIYPSIYSKYSLALSKLLNATTICNNKKELKTTKENIDKSYLILTTSYDLNDFKVTDTIQQDVIELVNDDLQLDDLQLDEEEEGLEPINIEYGMEEDQDEEDIYNDLMYAPDSYTMNADDMSMLILNHLKTDRQQLEYFHRKTKELFQDPNKNMYRINLYQ